MPDPNSNAAHSLWQPAFVLLSATVTTDVSHAESLPAQFPRPFAADVEFGGRGGWRRGIDSAIETVSSINLGPPELHRPRASAKADLIGRATTRWSVVEIGIAQQ
jgi:hypothetical protein